MAHDELPFSSSFLYRWRSSQWCWMSRMVLLEFFGNGGSLPHSVSSSWPVRSALAGAPLIAQLCYYTIIVLATVQPFRQQPGAPV